MHRVLLGLGSNRAFAGKTPLELLEGACGALSALLKDFKCSSVYKTKAMYVEDQEDFYNMAVTGFVDEEYSPFQLLSDIHRIEAEFGRDRSKEIRFGPRSIDIDIELFGNQTINTEELQIPHIRATERAFVMVPALEILDELADKNVRERYDFCLGKLAENGSLAGVEKYCSLQAVQNGTNRKS